MQQVQVDRDLHACAPSDPLPGTMASDARHWLHESYGSSEYESSRASRVAEARRLILGGDERIGGVAEAGRDGDVGYVGRACGCARSLLELKYALPCADRVELALACAAAGRSPATLSPAAEKLFDCARRLLDAPPQLEAAMRAAYGGAAFPETLSAVYAHLEDADGPPFAASERLVSRRRALTSYAVVERRYASSAATAAAIAELDGKLALGGRSHDALAALGLLRLALPTPRDGSNALDATTVAGYARAWRDWSADGGSVEADALWLTVLCRARKDPRAAAALRTPDFASRIFSEAFKAAGVPSGGGRGGPKFARAFAPRYRWLAWVGGDSPAERGLRKLCKMVVFLVSDAGDAEVVARHVDLLNRFVCALRPYYHPSNAGTWTPRLSLLVSELSRELAKGAARRRATLEAGAPARPAPSERTCEAVVSLLAPLARQALYSKHSSMVSAAIAALRDLSGVNARVVAEVAVPTLRAALEDARAVLWAHQAPAALRGLSALMRPLVLRRRHFRECAMSDASLDDPEAFCRGAFFDGALPHDADAESHAVDAAAAVTPPLARLVPGLMRAALLAVDCNDDAKTRCAMLFFDAVLRWCPARDDDDDPASPDAGLDALALDLGEWAPLFLDRVFGVVEHRDAAAKVPNAGAAGPGSRYVGAVASARDAASAELLRCVVSRLFARFAPRARDRATRRVASWALEAHAVPRDLSSAKDGASLFAACVAADPHLGSRASREAVDAVESRCLDASKESDSKYAFALRLYGGALRSAAPGTVRARADRLRRVLDAALIHDDKQVRKAARKLLRDALRGLLETRTLHHAPGAPPTDAAWPDDRDGDGAPTGAVSWIGPPRDAAERDGIATCAAGLVTRYASDPLKALLDAGGDSDLSEEATKQAWLRALRQLAHGVKGACAALDDGETDDAGDVDSPAGAAAAMVAAVDAKLDRGAVGGARTALVGLLVRAMDALARDPRLRRDAKVARAAVKAARLLLVLRGCAQVFRARAAIAAVRARRRAWGADAAASLRAKLGGEVEHRGDHDAAERALCHHWAKRLDAAERRTRSFKGTALAAPYCALLEAVLQLGAHDYADVRGAAAEALDGAWSMYGWALKPMLVRAIDELGAGDRGALYGAEGDLAWKRSSQLIGAATLLCGRHALRKLTLDGDLTAKLCEASCRPQRDLESLERDERDDVNNRLDGLVLCYAGRFLVPPAGVGALVATSLDACKDSKMHWRHRLVAGFVLAHALAASDADVAGPIDEATETAVWHFLCGGAATPDDAPLPRVALAALLRRLDAKKGAAQPLPAVAVRQLFDGSAAAPRFDGLLAALQREHRRERARDSEDGASARSNNPVVEALVREIKHSEASHVFPKTMVAYASRGFRSRHGRFVKRLCRAADARGAAVAPAVALAAARLMDVAPPSERGAATAAAAEAWGGALRHALAAESDATAPFFDPLAKAMKGASTDHATAWADALRYAVAGKRAGAFATSELFSRIRDEWAKRLDASDAAVKLPPIAPTTEYPLVDGLVTSLTSFLAPAPPEPPARAEAAKPARAAADKRGEASWSVAAKWLLLAPAVFAELGASRDAAAAASAAADGARLGRLLLAASDHAFQAVRDRIGQALACLCGAALPLGSALTPEDIAAFAATLERPAANGGDDAAACTRLKKRRETAYSLARHCAREGAGVIPAQLAGAVLDGCADPDEDHQRLAVATVGVVMLSPALRGDDAPALLAAFRRGVDHGKWRSRRAVAAFLGAYLANRYFHLSEAGVDDVYGALKRLLADDSSEVRDAACASLATLFHAAPPARLVKLARRSLDDATRALPVRSTKKKRKVAGAASPSDKSDDGGERLAAVQALAAAVIAFPYDVPAHVPDALVVLAKHSNLAASSLRHAAPIRETVKSTFSEFKRTHAETWDFIRPLFTTDQLDASAAPRPSPRASFFATVRALAGSRTSSPPATTSSSRPLPPRPIFSPAIPPNARLARFSSGGSARLRICTKNDVKGPS